MMPALPRSPSHDAAIAWWLAPLFALALGEYAIGVGGIAVGVAILLLTSGVLLIQVWRFAAHGGLGALIGRVFALALCLVPLLRVISLVLPLGPLPFPFWPMVIWVPIGAGVVALLRQMGLTPSMVGVIGNGLVVHLPLGLVGLPVGVAIFAFMRPQPLAAELTLVPLLLAIVGLFVVGCCEELLFRGLLLEAAWAALGRWGSLYASAVYAALQIATLSLASVGIAFVVAFGAAWWVQRTRSVAPVAVAHGCANVVAYLVLPIFTLLGAPEDGSGGALNAVATPRSVAVVLTPALRGTAQGLLVVALVGGVVVWAIAKAASDRGQSFARDMRALLIPCGIAGAIIVLTRLWALALGE